MALEVVREGMQQLPPDQRVLIALVCIDGLSYKETAAIVDVPIGTVMSRLARARRTLHEYLNREVQAQPKSESRHGRNIR
jgi:RNA polymerase sigma-70 factor (ECF subfamily)